MTGIQLSAALASLLAVSFASAQTLPDALDDLEARWETQRSNPESAAAFNDVALAYAEALEAVEDHRRAARVYERTASVLRRMDRPVLAARLYGLASEADDEARERYSNTTRRLLDRGLDLIENNLDRQGAFDVHLELLLTRAEFGDFSDRVDTSAYRILDILRDAGLETHPTAPMAARRAALINYYESENAVSDAYFLLAWLLAVRLDGEGDAEEHRNVEAWARASWPADGEYQIALVRQLIDWGYLDDACLDQADFCLPFDRNPYGFAMPDLPENCQPASPPQVRLPTRTGYDQTILRLVEFDVSAAGEPVNIEVHYPRDHYDEDSIVRRVRDTDFPANGSDGLCAHLVFRMGYQDVDRRPDRWELHLE